METERFDQVVRGLATSVTRRSATGALVGLMAAIAPATLLASGRGRRGRHAASDGARETLRTRAEGKKRKGKKKKHGPKGPGRPHVIDGPMVPPPASSTTQCVAGAICTLELYNATIMPCLKAGLDRATAARAKCDAAENVCAGKCARFDTACLNKCGDTADTCTNTANRQMDLEYCACDRQFPCCAEGLCTGL